MSAHLPLTTDRLTLRLLEQDDFEALHAFLSLPEIAEFQYWQPMDRETVAAKLADWMTLDGEEGRHLELGMVLKSTGTLIGHVFLGFRDVEARQGELGFTTHPDHQRQGLSHEAVHALMEVGLLPLRAAPHLRAVRCAQSRFLPADGKARHAP